MKKHTLQQNMGIEIYYFSGTGNSLHVARELQKRLPGSRLIPMVSAFDKDDVITNGDTVGFVFPLYLTTIPAPVRRFLLKLNLTSARYIFSVITRMGTFSVANIEVNRILKQKGKRLDLECNLNMANNSPTGIKPGKGDQKWVNRITEEKVSQIELAVQPQLDEIYKFILSREQYPQKTFPNPFGALLERLMYLLTHNTKVQIDFYADSTCTSCGICEKVCLSGKIHMRRRKPVWQNDVNCYYCYACFNFCPTQSILVKNKYTRKDGRYHHPDVTANEIAAQKQIAE